MLKLQSLLPLPSRANRAWLPAACAAVLLLGAAFQLAVTREVDVPEAGWTGGGARSGLPGIAAVSLDPVLSSAVIFNPQRTAMAASGPGAAAAPASAMLAGAITQRGRAFGVFQRSDGTVVRVPVGGTIEGARLVSLSSDGATIRRGGQLQRVAFGSRSIPAASQPDQDSVEEPEQ